MPNWLKTRLPGALGGSKDDIAALENMTLDSFASSIRQARRLGSLTGFVHGTSGISDASAQGTMRMFESVIEAMTPEEKADLSAFDAVARKRVAASAGCSTAQVDDCMARYLWMKSMTSKLAKLRREGKEMPKSIEEMERAVGNWRQYKSEMPFAAGAASAAMVNGDAMGVRAEASGAAGGAMVPMDAVGPKGQPCPLAGSLVGRNTKCTLTRKAYKACCGKRGVTR
jgi:hypothetical protein